jgi:hypothetical protein
MYVMTVDEQVKIVGLIMTAINIVLVIWQFHKASKNAKILKRYEGKITEEVQVAIEKAKTVLARELRTHETQLRLAADIHLRVHERMIAAVKEFKTMFKHADTALRKFADAKHKQANRNSNIGASFEAAESAACDAVDSAWTSIVMQIPELEQAANEAINMQRKLLRRLMDDYPNGLKDEYVKDVEEAFAEIGDAANQLFRHLSEYVQRREETLMSTIRTGMDTP